MSRVSNKIKETRRRARQRIGKPPETRIFRDRRRLPAKHKIHVDAFVMAELLKDSFD